MTDDTSNDSKLKIALGDGDYQDPGRYLERYRAIQYFCDVVTEMVPQCINDMFALAPYFNAELEDNRDPQLRQELSTKLDAWAHRYRLDRMWPRTAAINSVCHFLVVTRDRATRPELTKILPPPKRVLRIDSVLVQHEELGLGSKISEILEELNPGWHDSIYEFVIPPILIRYNPTTTKWSEIRLQSRQILDDHLKQHEQHVKRLVEEMKLPKAPTRLMDQHVRWYVRWLVLREPVVDIAESIVDDEKDPPRTRIHYGIDRVSELTGLASRKEIESRRRDKG